MTIIVGISTKNTSEKEPPMSIKYFKKYKEYLKKIANREMITYIIAGILTTAVNYISYYIICNIMGVENLTANAIAWILAVIFAYGINYIWVFQSNIQSIREEIRKIIKFVGARVFSLIVEELGLYIFVDLMHFNNMLIKALLAVFVVAINYIFSKLYIFNK